MRQIRSPIKTDGAIPDTVILLYRPHCQNKEKGKSTEMNLLHVPGATVVKERKPITWLGGTIKMKRTDQPQSLSCYPSS